MFFLRLALLALTSPGYAQGIDIPALQMASSSAALRIATDVGSSTTAPARLAFGKIETSSSLADTALLTRDALLAALLATRKFVVTESSANAEFLVTGNIVEQGAQRVLSLRTQDARTSRWLLVEQFNLEQASMRAPTKTTILADQSASHLINGGVQLTDEANLGAQLGYTYRFASRRWQIGLIAGRSRRGVEATAADRFFANDGHTYRTNYKRQYALLRAERLWALDRIPWFHGESLMPFRGFLSGGIGLGIYRIREITTDSSSATGSHSSAENHIYLRPSAHGAITWSPSRWLELRVGGQYLLPTKDLGPQHVNYGGIGLDAALGLRLF
jgi:hypothetical protein